MVRGREPLGRGVDAGDERASRRICSGRRGPARRICAWLWQHRGMRNHRLAIAFVMAAACGGSQKAVEVKGGDAELAKLAGTWSGDYRGHESGRAGTIDFALELGRHTAAGEIHMGAPDAPPLKIEFVAIDGGQVSGTIAPYTDPNCQCEVETTFTGVADGDSIAGTFATKVSANGETQSGDWRVTRKR